jgi:hypothetical protein
MALRYLNFFMFQIVAAYSNNDELCAAAVVMLGCKWRRGGYVLGHHTVKRSHFAADWMLNRDYFIDCPL